MVNKNKKDTTKILSISLGILALLFILESCQQPNKRDHVNQYKKNYTKHLNRISNYEDSLQLLLKRSIQEGDDIGKMLCYKELGNYQRKSARFSDAIISHQASLDIAIKLRDTIEIVQALNNLGTNFRRIGALSEASNYHYQALEVTERYSKSNELGLGMKNRVIAMNGIGNLSLSLGYYDDAEKYFRSALKDEKKLKSHIGQAINYANLGAILENRMQLDSARIYYQYSLEQNRLAKSDLGIGLCYIHFGDLYMKEKKYDLSKQEYLKAYKLMENISDRWHWLEACLSIADIYLITGDDVAFKKYIRQAELTAIEIKSPEHQSTVYKLKHKYNLKHGDYEQALKNYKLSKDMEDEIQGIRNSNHYMDLRVNYERSKSKKILQEIQLQNKLKEEARQRTLYIFWTILIAFVIILFSLIYAYRQRLKNNRILREIENTRTNFYTNITHEFRTPLTVIQGLNDLIKQRDNLNQEEKNRFTEAINRQCNKLLGLINQLLDIARIEGGMDQSEWKYGDIIAYLRMSGEAFQFLAEQKDIHFTFYSNVQELNMDFIPHYIDKIVNNLLSNALKHSSPGDKITFTVLKESSSTITINVKDTGEGIPKEETSNIFEMFYQSPQSKKAMGSGIGLAFTKILVEKLNGKIELQSELGKGSTFTIYLPLNSKYIGNRIQENEFKTELTDQINEDTNNNEIEIENQSATNEDVQKTCSLQSVILLIEDNFDIRLYIKSLLQKHYNIITARNGEEGFEMAKKYIPDLIITDIMMPIMDGYTFCSEMKTDILVNHIPIIMLTAKASEEDRLKGLKHGAEAYIRKPFKSEELFLTIKKILENRKLLKEKYMSQFTKRVKNSDVNDLNLKFLQKVTDTIYSGLEQTDVTSSFLADKMAMSTSQLSRKLNSLTGYSLASYILQVKLQKAKKLLRDSSLSIKEVSMDCGFEDNNYFSRVFKKNFGITPSQFQKNPFDYTK